MPNFSKAYDQDLAVLGGKIAAMGGQAERLVGQAVAAIVHADLSLARHVVELDLVLDKAQRDIDEHAVLLIAQRQPAAGDLREIVSALRISCDLERVGDMGKNIAKRVPLVAEQPPPPRFFRGLEALSEMALTQMKDVLDLFASRSIVRIGPIRDQDEEIDAMYTSLFRELLSYMVEDPRNITACTHLLFCAKNIERIGDHATNIVEAVHFMLTGRQMAAERPKVDKSHRLVANGGGATIA